MSERIPHSRPTVVAGMEEGVCEVLASGQHAGGAVRRSFERDFCQRLDCRHGVAVQSGFAALHLGLLALGVGSGDRVLVPSYVCASLLNAVDAVGAKPLIADVDRRFFNLTPQTTQDALDREKIEADQVACAIVPHILGFPAPIHRWEAPIPVIEDCAMALGARIGEEEVGGFGRLSTFSFYATKMISTGQGGMVLTDADELHRELNDRIRYDNRERWRPSWNYPLPDLAAALGRAQFRALDDFLRRRHELATHFRDFCSRLPVEVQEIYPETTPCFFRFVILLPDRESRNRTQRDLHAVGIECKSPIFRPLHRYLDLSPEDFPQAEEIQSRALSLPFYPSLTESERDRVFEAVERSLGV